MRVIHNKSKKYVSLRSEVIWLGACYATKDEYKQARKRGKETFTRPDNIPDFDPNIMENLDSMTCYESNPVEE